MDGWLNKTPRQKSATRHERRARRKATEKDYEAAYPVMKSRPLSGLHTIPKKTSKGAPLAASQRPKPPRDGRPKPPVGLQREPAKQGPGMKRLEPAARPKGAAETAHFCKRSRVPEPHREKEMPKTIHELARARGKLRSPPDPPPYNCYFVDFVGTRNFIY